MSVTAQGARSLALWVRAFYPTVYAALSQKVAARGAVLGTLGDFGCRCDDGLGQTTGVDFSPTTIDTGVSIDPTTLDSGTDLLSQPATTAPLFDTVDPTTFAPVTVETSDVLPEVTAPVDSAGTTPAPSSAATATSASPTSAGSSMLSAVGNFLTSSAGIASLVGLGTALVQNKTSQNVLAAQVARVTAGANPAAIAYTVNPTTGQVVPVLQTATPGVTLPVTGSLLNTLAPGGSLSLFLQQYGLWIGLGLLVLLIARR